MGNSRNRPAGRARWQILTAALAVAGTASLAPAQAPEENTTTVSENLHFTEKDLPSSEKDPGRRSEINDFARGRGFRYARDTRRARGEISKR